MMEWERLEGALSTELQKPRCYLPVSKGWMQKAGKMWLSSTRSAVGLWSNEQWGARMKGENLDRRLLQ